MVCKCLRSECYPLGTRLLAALLALAFCLPAHASEESDALFDLPLEELLNIVVTSASLFPESRWSSAATVDRIEEELHSSAVKSVSDALEALPGIQSYEHVINAQAVTVRGYAQFTSVRGIGVLIDGVPVNDFAFGSSQYDRHLALPRVLDQLELVRGPGSTLYGSDAFHGVLALSSFSATSDVSELWTAAGVDDYHSAALRQSEGLFGSSRLSLAAEWQHQGAQDQPYAFQPNDSATAYPARRSQDWEASNWSLVVHDNPAQPDHYRLQLYRYTLAGNSPGYGRLFGYRQADESSGDRRFTLLNASWVHELKRGHSLETQAYDWQLERGLEAESAQIKFERIDQQDKRGLALRYRYSDAHRRWLIGASLEQDRVRDSLFYPLNDAGQRLPPSQNPIDGVERRVLTHYAQGREQLFGSTFALEMGGRLDDYSRFGQHFSPRLGLLWEPTPRHILKLLYGHAFRAPSAVEQTGSPTFFSPPDLQPETFDSLEAVWFYQRETLNSALTLYNGRWQDGIVAGATSYDNVGQHSSRGAEWALNCSAGDWLWQTALSHARSRNDTAEQDYLAYPRWSLRARLAWQERAWLALVHDRDWHEGPASSRLANPELAAYTRIDLGWQQPLGQHWQFELQLRNALARVNARPSLVNAVGGLDDPGRSVFVGIRSRGSGWH